MPNIIGIMKNNNSLSNTKKDIKFYKPFTRKKILHGKPYLYEITPYFDPTVGKLRQKTKYLGKAEPDENTKKPLPKIRHLVDYGDAYLFDSLVKELTLKETLLKCFPEEQTNFILLLAGFRLLTGKSSSHLKSWLETSEMSVYYPLSFSPTSQNISKFLESLGRDEVEALPHFFLHWTQHANKKGESILFDLTSFSSQAQRIEMLEKGYNQEHLLEPQVNLGLLVNQTQRLPLYYKLYPGSIKDVTTLTNIVNELSLLQMKQINLILDRGFYSQSNISQMLKEKLNFVIPLNMVNKSLYQSIYNKHKDELEQKKNLYLIQEKPIYCVTGTLIYPSKPSTLTAVTTNNNNNISSNQNSIYYAIYLDKEKGQKEQTAFLTELLFMEQALNNINWSRWTDEKERDWHLKDKAGAWKKYFNLVKNNENNSFIITKNEVAINEATIYMGTTILFSSCEIDPIKLLPLYRERDTVEKMFDSCKNELAGLPLRVHKNNTMQGLFFILFISLIVQFYLLDKMKKGKLDPKFTISDIFFELHKLKKATWFGKNVMINEITKTQEMILKQLNILVPNF